MAMGIAKGIQYLHTGGVTGNSLKLENVLLDETLTARITNYNISLPSKVVVILKQISTVEETTNVYLEFFSLFF